MQEKIALTELGRQFLSMARPIDALVRDVAVVKQPRNVVDLEQWKTVVNGNFPDLIVPAEIALSVCAQLLVHDVRNCFAFVIIGPPSSGKTITLNFFDGMDEIMYSSDNFTPATFVSHIAGRSKRQLEQIDLLPRVRFKSLIVREMATVLSEKEDELRKRLGLLTRVLDGEGLETDSGVHGKRGYRGDFLFMMLCASVPFPLRVWKEMGNMGQRIFMYNMKEKEVTDDELLAALTGDGYKLKETACKQVTHDLLRTVWSDNPEGILWNKKKDCQDTLRLIGEMSLFVSRFRGQIIVFKDDDERGRVLAHTRPSIEDPYRAQQCLYNLARGHAVVSGRDYVTMEDMEVVIHVVLGTAPSPRPQIMRELLKNGGQMKVKDVAQKLLISKNTAKKECKKLIELEVLEGHVGKEETWDDDESDWLPNSTFGQSQWWVDIAPKFKMWRREDVCTQLEKMGVIV